MPTLFKCKIGEIDSSGRYHRFSEGRIDLEKIAYIKEKTANVSEIGLTGGGVIVIDQPVPRIVSEIEKKQTQQ